MNSGKCTKCDKLLTYVKIEEMDLRYNISTKVLGASYICPHCLTVLGVGVDPIALKTDTINGVVKALRR